MARNYKCSLRSVHFLTAQIVLVTKYRRKVINSAVSYRLKEIFAELCCQSGCVLKEFKAELDYVHLLIGFSPRTQLNNFVADIKTISTKLLHQEFSEHLNRHYRRLPSLWNNSYFVGSCGYVTDEQLKKYIEDQKETPPIGD